MEVVADVVLEPGELYVWDVYFGCCCAMFMHPGNRQVMTLEQLAAFADEMVLLRRRRFECRSS